MKKKAIIKLLEDRADKAYKEWNKASGDILQPCEFSITSVSIMDYQNRTEKISRICGNRKSEFEMIRDILLEIKEQ